MKERVSIFWFRRDLRLDDNAGLFHALASGDLVLPVFIFDTNILGRLENRKDRRVDYIHQALVSLNQQLQEYGAALKIYHGEPLEVFKKMATEFDIASVYCNRDYEPECIERDKQVYYHCMSNGIVFKAYKDQVMFDKFDVLKSDRTPYVVSSQYARKWRQRLAENPVRHYTPDYKNFIQMKPSGFPALREIGFEPTDVVFSKPQLPTKLINAYDKFRNYPSMDATTRLGIDLRFGTISIRECIAFAQQHNDTWLSELIWREFYMQILYHFPHVVQHSFKPKYDLIKWRNNEDEFERWCKGHTGYPIVDAGMRQLNETGFMHNRVRMITASFLCKHLLIDWRWGEAYFAEKLNDYDLAANNGNWQWVAGSGCDAAPYFRIFNPSLQAEKFDTDHTYIRDWVPEFEGSDYPAPMVEHRFARERALAAYNLAVSDKDRLAQAS